MKLPGLKKTRKGFIVVLCVSSLCVRCVTFDVDFQYFNEPAEQEDSDMCTKEKICECHRLGDHSLWADCSNLGLETIPQFNPNVTIIALQNNNISHFGFDNEIPHSIIYLDLSSNHFSNFNNNPFQHLNSLEYLDMSFNDLQYNSPVYKDFVFDGLSNLKYLNLKNNNNGETMANYSIPICITDIRSLCTLLIDGLSIDGIPKEFSRLLNLKTLDMSSTGYRNDLCHLKAINRVFFQSVSHIQHLNISGCHIHSIEKGAFIKLTNIKTLNISNNEHLTFQVLSNISIDLQFSTINVLDISKIQCTFGPGLAIYMDDIKYLNTTNITHLYINSNRLALFERGVVPSLPKSLKLISITDNRLSFGCYMLHLNSLHSLEVLSARNQYTSHDPLLHLKNINCNDWRQPPVTNEAYGCTNIFMLQNYSGRIVPELLLPPFLKTVYMQNSGLKYKIPEFKLSKNNVTHVELQHNLLKSWEGPVMNMETVIYLDLSNNYCIYVSNTFFNYMDNIETLLINDNLLGFMLNRDVNGNVFKNLEQLKLLDLSSNRIETLPSQLFHNQSKLKTLNLSNNAIHHLNFEISHLHKLEYLDLSNNLINTLKKHQRKQINELTNNNNFTINLSGNTLQCTCESLEFLKWLDINSNIFFNFNNYNCRFPNDTNTTFSTFHETLLQLESTCNSFTGLVLGVVSAFVLVVSVTISAIIYRYRWKIRYLYYSTKKRRQGYRSITINEEEENDYMYDAFISYCEYDGHFVRQDLVENLEKNQGLRLILHERNFIPGKDIAENITHAIHQSKKTVIILSESYLKSYWCMYEFNMARMESIYSRGGKSVVMLVFYKKVSPRDLPLSLMDIIDNRTFLEYPDDEQGNVVFWDNLVKAISK